MRVVSCNSFGPVTDLVVEERPSWPLAPGTVRVRVTACGVNFVDGLFVQGLYNEEALKGNIHSSQTGNRLPFYPFNPNPCLDQLHQSHRLIAQ